MRSNIFFLLVFGLFVTVWGCKDDPSPSPSDNAINPWDTLNNFVGIVVPKSGSITFELNHHYDGLPLEFASKNYTNLASDTFTINELKYYFTNVTLYTPTGEKLNLKNYHLVDTKLESSKTITITNVPAGNYTGISILLGVDAERNHSGLQEGALDPSWSMFWTWSTGYIFYRINGNTPSGKSYSYDLGGDNNLPIIQVDLKSNKVKSSAPKLKLDMNIAEMFKNPQTWSFKSDGFTIHSDTEPSAKKLATNMEDMFTLKSINP